MTRRKKKRVFTVFCTVLILLCVLFVYIDFRLSPIVAQMAKAKAMSIATTVINESIMESVKRDGITYDDLISFEKDNNGKITALKTNLEGINALKSSLAVDIVERLEAVDKSELSIPFGNVVDSKLLSGRGPLISIKLVPVGAVDIQLANEFTEAGINQTLHKIMMQVKLSLSVILPSEDTTAEISCAVAIAETVIVGEVPDAYTDINKIGDELLGDIVDYAATPQK